MGRRSDHSRDEIREMSLKAARSIMESEGYQGLTARKVAGEIGYTVGTLYLVFKNLDDLLVHVNTRTVAELHVQLKAAAESSDDPETRIRAMATAYIEYALENRNLWRSVFEHRLPADQEVPGEMLVTTALIFRQVAECLTPLASGKRRESIAEYATALWSGIHGICILSITQKLELGSPRSLFELADILVTNFIAGLTAD